MVRYGAEDIRAYKAITNRDPNYSHPCTVITLDGESIEVDNDMVSLIESLWKLDIRTTNCCQGFEGQLGYLSIDAPDFPRFLELFADVIPLVRDHGKVYFRRFPDREERFDADAFARANGDGWRVTCTYRFPPGAIVEALTARAEALVGALPNHP